MLTPPTALPPRLPCRGGVSTTGRWGRQRGASACLLALAATFTFGGCHDFSPEGLVGGGEGDAASRIAASSDAAFTDASGAQPNDVPKRAEPDAAPVSRDGAASEDGGAPDADVGPSDGPAGDRGLDASMPLSVDARVRLDVAQPLDAAQPAPKICRLSEECAAGETCLVGTCRAALASCAAIKGADPAAPDGVYWIKPSSAAYRAYCDMQQKVALCTETEAEHEGVTRDAAQLRFRMRSLLEATAGTCKLWAVRDTAAGHPLDQLVAVPGLALGACAALGFKADSSFGACKYGANPGHTACGFGGTAFSKWANSCTGCTMNDGQHTRYVLQGKVYVSTIPWNVNGTIFSRCQVR